MSRPAAFLPALLLTTLLTTMMSIQANGQVTIRDTVEIRSPAIVGKKDPPPPVPVPVSEGTLCAYYDNGLTWRLGAPIPNAAIVSVTNNSILFASDSVTARLPVTTSTPFFACGSNVTKYAQGPLISDNERRWSIGSVQQEDEILVYYSRGTVPTVITQTGNGWTARMGATCPPPHQAQYLEHVQVSFAVVEPDTSLTVEFSQSTVWPALPTKRAGAQGRIIGEVDDVVDVVTIELTDGCAPISHHEVAITAAWVYASNGHLHQASNDSTPVQDSLGVFTVIDSSRAGKGNIVTRTGPDGKIRLSYKAPQYGGRVNIIAETVLAGDTLVNANQLVVEVPGLELFPFSSDYKKIGGTTNHPGPDDNPQFGFTFRPDTNHWGRVDFIDSLLALVEKWNAKAGSPELYFNDMSLMRGGMFDVAGLWSILEEVDPNRWGHNQHRVGRDVDIKVDGGVRSIRLEKLIKEIGGCPLPHHYGGGIYHMYFYPERYPGECGPNQ